MAVIRKRRKLSLMTDLGLYSVQTKTDNQETDKTGELPMRIGSPPLIKKLIVSGSIARILIFSTVYDTCRKSCRDGPEGILRLEIDGKIGMCILQISSILELSGAL